MSLQKSRKVKTVLSENRSCCSEDRVETVIVNLPSRVERVETMASLLPAVLPIWLR